MPWNILKLSKNELAQQKRDPFEEPWNITIRDPSYRQPFHRNCLLGSFQRRSGITPFWGEVVWRFEKLEMFHWCRGPNYHQISKEAVLRRSSDPTLESITIWSPRRRNRPHATDQAVVSMVSWFMILSKCYLLQKLSDLDQCLENMSES